MCTAQSDVVRPPTQAFARTVFVYQSAGHTGSRAHALVHVHVPESAAVGREAVSGLKRLLEEAGVGLIHPWTSFWAPQRLPAGLGQSRAASVGRWRAESSLRAPGSHDCVRRPNWRAITTAPSASIGLDVGSSAF